MTSINIALPALRCTSCNKVIGHLIPDFYKFHKILLELLNNKFDFNRPFEMISSDGRNIYDLFIQPFYLNADNKDLELFDPAVLICYGLLSSEKLTEFPLRAKVYKRRYCCNRMFLCDSSTGFN